MAVALDLLAKTLLDAPVGYVEQTVSDILKKPVHFEVIEQYPTYKTNYIRKISISYEQLPIILATIKFDSDTLPSNIASEMLTKKKGIGNILKKHQIIAHRKMIKTQITLDGKKIVRDYEILNNNAIWFQIHEEIRLDHLSACKNR